MRNPYAAVLAALFAAGFFFSPRLLQAQSPASQPQSSMQTNQAATPEQPGAPVVRATTRLVQVDVLATDARGNPVTDLTRDDFRLEEQGRLQSIAHFSQAKNAAQRAAPATTATPGEAAGPGKSSGNTPLPLTILLFDGLNTAWRDQVYACQQLMQYLQTPAGVNQQIALLVLSDSLRLLQGPTTDTKLLAAKLKSYSIHGSQGMQMGEAYTVSAAEAAAMPPRMLETLEETNRDRLRGSLDVRGGATLDAFESLARVVRGYPGRKSLIWISAAFPLSFESSDLGAANFERMKRASAMLREQQVAIYPVDARALLTATTEGAFSDVPFDTIRDPADPETFDEQLTHRLPAVAASQGIMEQLAAETGGQAFINRNNLSLAIALSTADNADYYTLEYYPAGTKWDGNFHRIKIGVARHGVKLRYRSGYNAVDAVPASK